MQQLLVSYLLNAVWQVPVVALCGLGAARFAGLSPRSCNGLWLGFLAAAAILPAVSLGALLPHATPTVARVPAGVPLDAPALAAAHAAPAPQPVLALAPWAAGAMIALVALAALLLVARLIVAGIAARRLVSQSRAVTLSPEVSQAVERLARAHRRATPPVRRSAAVSSPAVVGALRPVILIPDAMAADGEDLRAALLHEMAHVVRHDYAINLACEIITLPVGWHPALLGIKAGVRRSRELACDAMAAGAMASPKTYAKCLVSLAQTLGAPSCNRAAAPASAALAVGLFGRSDLEDRLMQLMTPRDAEAPLLRGARLCGLAAIGAGLLGSAALLHVTPVFAQPAAPRALAATPATPATAATAATPATPATPATAAIDQARQDAGPSPAEHHRTRLVYSHKGVIIERGQGGYRHSFTGADGQPMSVINDDPSAPSVDQQRAWEDDARKADAEAAKAENLVNSPEFKARIENAKAQAAAAEKMVNSPEFKARIAKATAQAADAQRMVNSPAFKAKIARAQAQAADAERMVNSPEFKARIARATAQAARVDVRANLERAQAAMAAASAQLQRQLDDLPARDGATATPAP